MGLILTGFGLGTFKFMFAHWAVYGIGLAADYEMSFIEIFISVEAGALTSMTVFYWFSGLIMRAISNRRMEKHDAAIAAGKIPKRKKIFTKVNKTIVWVRRGIGIYGITFIAPLVMSVPIGSVVCAKFYGNEKRTFPLMVIFTLVYSFLMCLWIKFG
ncbi:hypothetical protein JYT72_01495 [Crocinitomix catalasitica]|nr:hypothetical protein [Crocinitomix catalasitica]